ncbi:MAG: type II toxin-antitoxin system PemK/MazF family toxin [Candidatus Acidiferrum sp.]
MVINAGREDDECPVTSQIKNYPFEVPLPLGSKIRGVILADQLKSLDWRQRRAEKFGKIPSATLDEVRQRVATLLGFVIQYPTSPHTCLLDAERCGQ